MNDKELKQKILKGIGICHEMESIWWNNSTPSYSFRHHVKSIRYLLESLLEVKDNEQTMR